MVSDGARTDASTFIFRAGQYDDEFHRLDRRIADMARATPGYLGEETWENAEAGLIQNVYYWESEAAPRQLMQHPARQSASTSNRLLFPQYS
ncbi:antibiotic biosynthesis monooxygenase [Burkholderia anthina]|nr:antibiotic biosynthesis monooxygenase [Burkholderia anthina]